MIPLTTALLLLLALFTFAIYSYQQKQILIEVESRLSSARGLLENLEEREGRELGGTLKSTIQISALRNALRSRNRKDLLKHAKPLYEDLKDEMRITHFYFTGPDLVNILRVHKPEKYGDVINRITTLQAQRTGTLVKGIELGPLGTMTLRVVTPVFDGDDLIGYVEMGTEIGYIIRELKDILNLEFYLFLHKKFLNRELLENGMDMFGMTRPWDRFPSSVLVDASLKDIPEDLEPLLDASRHTEFETDLQVLMNGRQYRCRFIDLRDSAGREVGELVLLHDITDQFTSLYRIAILNGSLSLLIGVLLLVLFYSYLGRIEQELDTAHGKILNLERDRSRFILENLPVHVSLLDEKGCFLQWNTAAEIIFGINRQDALENLRIWDILENPKKIEAIQQAAINRSPVDMEVAAKTKNDDSFWIRLCLVPMPQDEETDRMLCFAEDISARKNAEMDRILLEKAIEQAAEIVMITDRKGIIQYVNPAFERITGYSRVEVIGKTPSFLKSGRHSSAFYARLWNVIAGGEIWQGRFTNKKSDGSLYDEEASISPMIDDTGKISSFVAVTRDVTDELKMERRIRQTQKMEAIGTLAGGIAHDFNNILSAIMGYSELASDELSEKSEAKENLEMVLKAANRAKNLVRQILTFSRQTEQEKKPIQISIIVKEVLNLIRATFPATIEIRFELENDLFIMGDSTQIHQVIMNLCSNAGDAMEEMDGVLEVCVESVQLGNGVFQEISNLAPGDYIRLSISDTGCGMPRNIVDRIFDPFFTTKDLGKGTGMGLAVVHGIVKSHEGAIKVYSEPDRGTTFTLYFPSYKKMPENSVEAQETLQTGKERILFLDDEPPLSNLGKKLLEKLGYRVKAWTSSIDALEAFRANPHDFDLVITDKTMPHLTGFDLSEEIKRIRPNIPIIMCSGFINPVENKRAKAVGVDQIILKPYKLGNLSKTVREVLDGAGSV